MTASPRQKTISFSGSWVGLREFEKALRHGSFLNAVTGPICFQFPIGCKVMVDAALRLLSLCNQLDLVGKRVQLVFADEADAYGYLDRIGFFDHLARAIAVTPERPAVSGAETFKGRTPRVVEIAAISPERAASHLPTRLADALERSVQPRARAEEVAGAAFTVFAELIQNIPLHSETPLDGYAALQVYERGGRAKVSVSDSGRGIVDTLRPALREWNPRAAALGDTDLVVEAFRNGLSRHGHGHGCGLQTSARHALRFKAELDIRLPTSGVHLVPSADGYRPHVALCSTGLPLIWGTHICFDFRLDS